jgi:hypothetical protein
VNLHIVDLRSPVDRAPGWWAAQCRTCKKWLTKYEHSPEDAEAHAADHMCVGGGR